MSTKTRKKSRTRVPAQQLSTVAPTKPKDGAVRPTEPAPRAASRKSQPQPQTQPRKVPTLWIAAGAGVLGLALLLLVLTIFRNDTVPIPISPDGRILFLRTSEDGARNLFAVNPDGQGQVQVTRDLAIEGSWSWSPDMRTIVAQIGDKGQSEIALITLGPDGKAASVVSLTADINADAAFPAWSPDGSKIAFQHKGAGGFQVFVMDADGQNKRKLSGGTGYAGLPAWSPDGKQLLFIAGDGPDVGTPKELYIAEVDGPDASPRKLTSFGKDISRPSWSPDDQQIAYVERVGDRTGAVMIVGIDGQNPRKVGDGVSNSSPQFSPKGDLLLYYNVAPPDGSDIFIFPVAGGQPTNITQGPGEDYVPGWSPDGTQIAWASIVPDSQGHKIVVANSDGTARKVVSTGDGDDYQPVWGTPQEYE